MLSPVRVVAPAVSPVSAPEARKHLRVDDADDDDLIDSLIAAATTHLDGWSGILGRCLVTQTWEVAGRAFACPLRLPLAPVQSIVSVIYRDAADAEQTVDAADYALLTDALGPHVDFVSGYSFPAVYRRADAVRVRFVAGYGDPPAVPAPIRTAIMLMVGKMYALAKRDMALQRETVEGVGTQVWGGGAEMARVIDGAADALLSPYRRIML